MKKIEKLEEFNWVSGRDAITIALCNTIIRKQNEIINYLNTQPQTEECTHSFDLNNRCSKCGVRGVKDMIAELQDTPKGDKVRVKDTPEEWKELETAINIFKNRIKEVDEIGFKVNGQRFVIKRDSSKLKDNK